MFSRCVRISSSKLVCSRDVAVASKVHVLVTSLNPSNPNPQPQNIPSPPGQLHLADDLLIALIFYYIAAFSFVDHFDISSDLRVILKTPVIADHPQGEIFNLHCKVQTLLNLKKKVFTHSPLVQSRCLGQGGACVHTVRAQTRTHKWCHR